MQNSFIGMVLNDRYILNKIIGMGGMAIVYLADDKYVGTTVAIKILKEQFGADEHFKKRFSNESKAIAMLNDPNIVDIFDVNLQTTPQYIVMEYLDGVSLKTFIEKKGKLSPQETLYFTKQILTALAHAHERGIVHRDIKPQNMIILKDGTLKVTDFGIASLSMDETITMTDKAIGTVHYISPEQASGKRADQKSDLYSLGVMMYEMMLGQLPFDGETAVSVALKQVQTAPKRLSEIDPTIDAGLEEIILKAMMKDPEKRYHSAEEMLADMEAYEADNRIIFGYDLDEEASGVLYAEGRMLSPEEQKKRNRRNRILRNVIPICSGMLAALIFSFSIFALMGMVTFFNPDTQITVPDFVGMSRIEVEESPLYDTQFNIRFEEMHHPEVSEGYIFEQSLQPDLPVFQGREITLQVSRGRGNTYMPRVENTMLDNARFVLNQEGILDIQLRFEEVDESLPSGMVLRTDPLAGSVVSDDEPVVLYVSISRADPSPIVPTLEGHSLDDARKLAEDNLFNLAIEGWEHSEDVEAGFIISQDIEAGSTQDPGTDISVIVSRGRPGEIELTVPSRQTNETLESLIERIKEAGFTGYINWVYVDTTNQNQHGRVTGITPAAGSRVSRDATFTIRVYRFRPPAPTEPPPAPTEPPTEAPIEPPTEPPTDPIVE